LTGGWGSGAVDSQHLPKNQRAKPFWGGGNAIQSIALSLEEGKMGFHCVPGVDRVRDGESTSVHLLRSKGECAGAYLSSSREKKETKTEHVFERLEGKKSRYQLLKHFNEEQHERSPRCGPRIYLQQTKGRIVVARIVPSP